jgi:quercetin dioxygenase-like cupin family protein
MPEHLVNARTTPPADFSDTAFAHLEVKLLVSAERSGSQLTYVGQTTYPAGGATHEAHFHPDAEETIIVQSGTGRHRVGDDWYDLAPGDVLFVPKGAVHTTVSGDEDDLVIFWVLGGAASLEAAGYVSATE